MPHTVGDTGNETPADLPLACRARHLGLRLHSTHRAARARLTGSASGAPVPAGTCTEHGQSSKAASLFAYGEIACFATLASSSWNSGPAARVLGSAERPTAKGQGLAPARWQAARRPVRRLQHCAMCMQHNPCVCRQC